MKTALRLTASIPKRRYDLLGKHLYAFMIIKFGAAQVDDEVGYTDVDVALELLANRCRIADQGGRAERSADESSTAPVV